MIDLSVAHQTIIKLILQNNLPNTQAWYFGSRVLDCAKPFSDIDIVVAAKNKRPLSLSTMAKTKMAFEESDLPFCVDLCDWYQISDSFRKKIKEHRVPILL